MTRSIARPTSSLNLCLEWRLRTAVVTRAAHCTMNVRSRCGSLPSDRMVPRCWPPWLRQPKSEKQNTRESLFHPAASFTRTA